MKAVFRTDKGKVRASNQDALVVLEGKYPVYAVADGMGGHRGGDVASAMTVAGVKRMLAGKEPSEKAIRSCVSAINLEVFNRQKEDDTLSGMGTTLTLLWVGAHSILLGHVGDSRAYLMRDEKLSQVSTDHSLVSELLRSGVLNEESARAYPYRNIITRAVGSDRRILCDTVLLERRAGDRFLLCSDGLTDCVEDEVIERLMGLPCMDSAADQLMAEALEGGGRDNITLVMVEVTA